MLNCAPLPQTVGNKTQLAVASQSALLMRSSDALTVLTTKDMILPSLK